MITLTLKEQPNVPLEAEVLSPDAMAALANDAIRALPVYLGKKLCRVDDFFAVEGEASDELKIRGDARKVKWIGRGMTRGRITIVGNAGMHLGAYMTGGAIEVSGNASDWLGGEMTGGLIRIRGNAGGQVGAAYRGSRAGMTGRDHPRRRHGWPRSRDADEAGHHRDRRHGEGFRRPGDERRDHRSAQRSRDSDRRLDDAGHDRLLEADPPVAELLVRVHVQSDLLAAVRKAPGDAGLHHSL